MRKENGERGDKNLAMMAVYIVLLLTGLVFLESINQLSWSPYFIIYAVGAIVVPLILMPAIGIQFGRLKDFKIHRLNLYLILLLAVALFVLNFEMNSLLKPALNQLAEAAAQKFGWTTIQALGIFAIYIIVWAPIAEELLYRGLLQGTLRKCYSFNIAVLVSSFFFGIRHATHLFFLWPNVLYEAIIIWAGFAFIAGLIYGYIYERTKSLYLAIIVHFAINLLALLATF